MKKLFLIIGLILILTVPVFGSGPTSTGMAYDQTLTTQGTTNLAGQTTANAALDKRLDTAIYVGDPNYTTLALADAAATAAGKLLVIPKGTYSIVADYTLTSAVKVLPGAVFAVATTKTLTINGSLDAGLYQIFSCTGTGKVVFGAGAVKEVYPEWWGAVPDNSTDCTAAIQAALTSCYNSSNGVGTVFLSAGQYKITTALAMPPSVNMIGANAEKTVIEATACDGLVFDSSSATTNLSPKLFTGFKINGTGCGQKIGIKSLGTADIAQKLEQVQIEKIRISNFGTGVYWRNVWNSKIADCNLYPVHVGIKIAGQCIMTKIHNNNIENGTVTGATGTAYGIYVDKASDYDPGGITVKGPEDVSINKNLIYAFEIGIHIEQCVKTDIIENESDHNTLYSIYLKDTGTLVCKGNYLELYSPGPAYIILDTPAISLGNHTKLITENYFAGNVNSPLPYGIWVKGVQKAVISKNSFPGLGKSIYADNPGLLTISENSFLQSVDDIDIYITNLVAPNIVNIKDNIGSMGRIYVDPTNTGRVIIGEQQSQMYPYLIRGKTIIPAGLTTKRTTFVSLPDYSYAGINPWLNPTTYFVQPVLRILSSSVDLGHLRGEADYAGVTINCSTAAPVGDAQVDWEVTAMPDSQYFAWGYGAEIATNGDSEAAVMTIGGDNTDTNCSFAQSAVQKHAGANSSLLTRTPGAGYALRSMGSITEFLPNHWYELNVWVYIPSTNTGTTFTVDDNYNSASTVTASVTDAWTKVTMRFRVGGAATGCALRFILAAGAVDDVVYLDDLSVKEVN